MNTPAHLAASVLVWRNEQGWAAASSVALGAILPDAPMYWFYAFQKINDRSEQLIWSTLYFDSTWQLVFDAFNSIPIYVAALAICHVLKLRWASLIAASALLHCVCDLPLHHDDAHRHFLPLTHWRFESPISYWDPNHFGHYFLWLELGFALTASFHVARTGKSSSMRALAAATLALYAAGIVFAAIVWSAYGRS